MMKSTPLILLAILFGACAAEVPVQTEFNPAVDFGRYATFSFAEPNVQANARSVAHDPRVLESIRETIFDDLSGRPMTLVQTGADLLIAISLAVGEGTVVDSWGYEWSAAGSQAAGSSYSVKEGTLTIDFFDGSSDQLVWRSWTDKVVSRTGDPDLKLLERMVRAMLQEYPPDSSKD